MGHLPEDICDNSNVITFWYNDLGKYFIFDDIYQKNILTENNANHIASFLTELISEAKSIDIGLATKNDKDIQIMIIF